MCNKMGRNLLFFCQKIVFLAVVESVISGISSEVDVGGDTCQKLSEEAVSLRLPAKAEVRRCQPVPLTRIVLP